MVGSNKGYVIKKSLPKSTAGLASETYVDNKVSSSGAIPVGAIMIWMSSNAPAGWFKLQGSSFDTSITQNCTNICKERQDIVLANCQTGLAIILVSMETTDGSATFKVWSKVGAQ